MARQVDFYGTSFYPKHSSFVDRDVPWRGALLDFARSFGYAEGRGGFYVGELQAGFGTIALNVSPTVTPEDLRVWTWSALARGAKGVNYYAWYPMSSGYESGGFGMIQLDGTVTERARAAGEIARAVDRNQKLFLTARPPKSDVAVIYNPLMHFVGGRQRAASYGGPQGEVAGIERDSLLGVYRALFPLSVPIDYVHINDVAALRNYKLVILPYPPMLPESSAEALKSYVRNGGHLVAEARLGWSNERGVASERIPGMGLWELMGCRELAVQTGARGRTELHWTDGAWPGMATGEKLAARWYEETLEPTSDAARVVARFADGGAAAVASSYGRGQTLMLGSYLSAAYESTPTREVERFYAGLLKWAGVVAPAIAGGVEVRTLESGTERVVVAFNHGKTAADAVIAVDGTKAIDLVTGAVVPVSGGELNKRMATGEVWAVRVSR
jgi:beta-galactosidase